MTEPDPQAPTAVQLPSVLDALPVLDLVEGMPFASLPQLAPSPDAAPLDILPPVDSRRPVSDSKVPPACLVCQITVQDSGGRLTVGTAWLAGPQTLITAGHVIARPSKSWQAQRVWVVPGRAGPGSDAASCPFGYTVAASWQPHPRWMASESNDQDIAAVWLDRPLFQHLGWFGMFAPQPQALLNHAFTCAGYPLRSRLNFGVQWLDQGAAHRVDPGRIAYRIDTDDGQSGAPLYVLDAQGRPWVIGVHTDGDLATNENRGVLITADILAQLRQWQR